MIGLEAQVVIGFNSVLSCILQLVRQELIHEPDSTTFLKLINQDARAGFSNRLLGVCELISTIATGRSENITRQTLRVDSYEGSFDLCGSSHQQNGGAVGSVF